MSKKTTILNYIFYVIAFILLCITTVDILGFLQPSIKYYGEPYIASKDEIWSIWGFDWSKNLDLRIEYVEEKNNLVVKKISYTLFPWTPQCRVKGWLYYSRKILENKSRLPAILLIHGLGQSHLMYTRDYPLVDLLVDKGYIVYAIDAPGHGESCIIGSIGWREAASKIDNITENLFYQVYVAGVRGVEVLKKIDIVDPRRIAVAGASMGGLTTLVVTSLHNDVVAGIVVVASGCITCMIESGGLANFVIGNDGEGSEEIIKKVSLIDPLSYVRLASANKKFLILFSTHDEYFPLEGFLLTVDIMRNRCVDAIVYVAPNNNHFKPYPGWIDTALEFLVKVFSGENLDEYSLCRLKPYRENLLYYTYDNASTSWYRLSIKGTKYFIANPSMPILYPIESFGVYNEDSFTYTTEPVRGGLLIGLILLFVSILLIGLILIWIIEPSLEQLAASITSYIASILVLTIPYIYWPNRFEINFLEFTERYGVALTNYLGIDMLLYTTMLCIIAPPLAFTGFIVRKNIVRTILVVLYTVLQLTPFIIVRHALTHVAGGAPYINIYPIEVIAVAPLVILAVLALYRYYRVRKHH